MKIRELVNVSPQPTVVRLDQLDEAESARWITEAYYITEEIERHFRSMKTVLGKRTGCGVFLIGHYGSGKSHFLAFLTQQIRAGSFSSRKPDVVPISLLNYKATQHLESIVEQTLDVGTGHTDRRRTWGEIQKRHPRGLLLVLDELSEFLRSKPDQQSFNEDVRFLQFLGEWSQDQPLWIIAALQEAIEHAGDIEYDLYRKIKDRYPIRFILTPTHVKSLIAGKILQKKPEYPRAVEKLARELKEVFPNASINFSDFCEVYPLHPATLDLLEEVRDRFSQSRGIVDFSLTRLLGDEARGVAPFLDQPWGHLISPDLIVDHFQDLFEVQPEFQPIAQKVLPYYRKHLASLFEKKLQRELALRVLKLLVLVNLSPSRKTLGLQEAAEWLLFKVSSIDPQRNVDAIERVLSVMAKEGSYVKREGSRYRLDLEDDSRQSLERLLGRTIEELQGRGEAIFETLIQCLAKEQFNPFTLPRDRWHVRSVRWHFHDREVQVFFGQGQAPECRGLALQIGLPWGPPAAGAGCFRISPRPIELNAEILELAALLQLKEGPLAARVLKRVEEKVAGRSLWFASLVRTAYAEATVTNAAGAAVSPPIDARATSVESWLNSFGEWMLRQTYPQFEKFAPGHGPLPKEAYRQFMKQAIEADICAEQAPDYVKLIREAYLVPMGLMQRRGFEYSINAKLDQQELVSLITPILEHQPSAARIYDHLSAPVYGLVPDQISLLLLTLLVMGEIDILKGSTSYRESYETLPNPIHYDRVVPGQALSLTQLRDLQTLCEGFGVRTPRQWSVLAQRRAIDQLKRIGARQRDRASEFLIKLKSHGDAGEVPEEVQKLIDQWLALEKGTGELQGFQHFVFAVGSAERFVQQAKEIESLPDRFERLLSETERFRHLFGYPCIARCANADVAVLVESLGAPPSLANPEALEAWLGQARRVYQVYQGWYRTQHEEWWDKVRRHSIWSYRRPRAAASKHLGLDEVSREIETLQSRAQAERCVGVVNLEFQPVCRCGFDGEESQIAETLRKFEDARSRLEEAVVMFFGQEQVRARVKLWVDQGLEINTGTLSYLEGKADRPEIENLPLFDQHLAGLELVRIVDADTILDLFGERTWQKHELVRELERLFERIGPRLSIRREAATPRRKLVGWCVEQCLRRAVPLPESFSLAERRLMAEAVQPEWVSDPSLCKLEELGLGDETVNCVLGMILDGRIQVRPDQQASPAVRAALELLGPSRPATADELARLIALLYWQHHRFVSIRPKEWLARLDDLASAELEPAPLVPDLLKESCDSQWVLIDCLGAALLEPVKQSLKDYLTQWRLAEVNYGLVSTRTSTDAFYGSLLEQGVNKRFEKIDAIDALIHTRKLNPVELAQLAQAELDVAFKKLARKLDPSKPVLVFADHGFRLTPDGAGFTHGGASTLERLVPVLRLNSVN